MNALSRQIVIHWADQTARVTPEQPARDCGVSVSEVGHALEELEAHGLLVRRPDGEYDAATPEAVGR